MRVSMTPLDEAAAVDQQQQATRTGWSAATRQRLAGLQSSGTTKAAGLAVATMAANVVAVLFTMVFTRILGADGYGSLAALINLTVILFVPGSALQVAAAREGTLGMLGRDGELAATLARWSRHLLAIVLVVAAFSVVIREPLAALLNVDHVWAAAAVPVTATLWLLLSVQRGLLQAARAYRAVGWSILLEASGRLAMGLALVGAGLGVTGAYLGTFASVAITALALELVLRRRLGRPEPHTPRHPLRALARHAALPIVALTLVAALQNVDVIVARHALDASSAGIYAAATVAAKAIVWIAVGIGLWVLPEATRRAARGQDPRAVLLRALALIGGIAAVSLLVFGVVPSLLLRLAFGPEYETGSGILLALGAAYALLAAAYVTVQYLLGLRRHVFMIVLAVLAAAEPVLLYSADGFTGFAAVVLAVQAAAAVSLVAYAVVTTARRPVGA
jgi:O-antigen/teichoic acid export membrane protein